MGAVGHGTPGRVPNTHIELTPVELTLKRLLLDVVQHAPSISSENKESLVSLPPSLAAQQTVLRFTGGWVRDKLLGVGSHDIDVAINNMTGEQFGLRLIDYLGQPGNAAKYGLEGVDKVDAQGSSTASSTKYKPVGGLHKIEANPVKSKHLETVTTRLLGLDIDLVNLRKETYSDASRNPQIEFGTPEEDALRRDATINAMFYNLTTSQVEDLTDKGLLDLSAGIIRTPMPAEQTFQDDPLRILRLIRFASRLNFDLDADAAQSMRGEDVRKSLRLKISRERIGIEVEKMLRGPHPAESLRLIQDAGLWHTIFCNPNVGGPQYEPVLDRWLNSVHVLDQILNHEEHTKELLLSNLDDEDRYICWVLTCLVPLRNAPLQQGASGKKPPPPIATDYAREGIKATNKICDVTTASIRNGAEISELVYTTDWNALDRPAVREKIGTAVRAYGSKWRLQALYNMLADVFDGDNQSDDVISRYAAFARRVLQEDLGEAYSIKPLLDGKQLAKAMGVAPGPWMKDALEVIVKWQLRNPGDTSQDKAIEEVRRSGVHGELSADLVKHFLLLTIRPLFKKSQPPTVTESGRKSTSAASQRSIALDYDEATDKPWRRRETQAVDLLSWTIHKVDSASLEQHWHLLIPPVLTMIDDWQVPHKSKGCELLNTLLRKTPSQLLAKTGLYDVFREALLPCFGFLPTLTEEKESAELLEHAFPACLALADVGSQSQDGPTRLQRMAFFDALVRKGVVAVLSHCADRPVISTVVYRNLVPINDRLGLESIKHLRSLLAKVNDTLSDPFMTASPQLLTEALRALQSVMRNAWPRVAANKAEFLRGLTMCWLQLQETTNRANLGNSVSLAKETFELLQEAIGADDGFDAALVELVQADDRLRSLFGK